jgi:sortase A
MFKNKFNDGFIYKIIRKNFSSYLILLMLIIAFISFAQGSYMFLKANVAQYLLNQAWEKQSIYEKSNTTNKAEGSQIKPWPWADFFPVAKLSFDRMKITQIVLNNDSGQALAFGPGVNQWLGTNIESNQEVVVIAAHNDTHFSILNDLQLNDNLTLTLKSGVKQTFTVNNTLVIDLKTQQLVMTTEQDENNKQASNHKPQDKLIKELILVTCYPFDGISNDSNLRYVVYLS